MSYECRECGREFNRKDHRRKHENQVHDEPTSNIIKEWEKQQ